MSLKLFNFISNEETSEALDELNNNKETVAENINEEFEHPCRYECTCLYLASNNGQDAVLEGILAVVGLDVDKGGPYKSTPLHAAVYTKRTAITKKLLQAGAGCLSDIDGVTPIHNAAAEGHTDVLKELLLYHSDKVNLQDNLSQGTALHDAVESGHLTAATLLIEGGADPNIKNNKNSTAYDLALNYGHDDVAKYLKGIQQPQQSRLSTMLPTNQTSDTAVNGPALNPPTTTMAVSSTTAPINQPQHSHDDVTDNLKQLPSLNESPQPKNAEIIETTQSTENQSIHQKRFINHENKLGKSEHHGNKIDDHRRRLDDIENRLARLECTDDSENTAGTEGAATADIVKSRFIFLTDNLIAEEHTDYLYQESALSEEDLDQIEAEHGNKRKTRRLLRILLSKPSHNWTTQFKESIRKTDATKHVCETFKWSNEKS